MKLQMGKGRRGITPCGGCSTVELLPLQVGQIGLEPTTDDNPQLRPIKLKAGKKATVELPSVLPLHHRGIFRGAELNRHCRVPRTHNLRPAKETRINNCRIMTKL